MSTPRSTGTGGRRETDHAITDMFWGDRIGGVEDPYGQNGIAGDPQGELRRAKMAKREPGAFYAQMGGPR